MHAVAPLQPMDLHLADTLDKGPAQLQVLLLPGLDLLQVLLLQVLLLLQELEPVVDAPEPAVPLLCRAQFGWAPHLATATNSHF